MLYKLHRLLGLVLLIENLKQPLNLLLQIFIVRCTSQGRHDEYKINR